MGFMEKAAAKLATKYGTVTRGKHSGCQIALGNPPEKKVETTHTFTQIIFVDNGEEKGRYNLLEDLIGMTMMSSNDKGFHFILLFKNEENCEFDLEIKQEDKPLVGMLKSFLGQKTTAGASPKDKAELQYHNVKVFVQNMGLRMLPKDLRFFRDKFTELGILDNLTNDILDIILKNAPEVEE